MWLIGFYPLNIFSHQMCFIRWILLIVYYKIDSCLMHCYSFLKVLNQNLNLKFHQMNFCFEFLDIHMNEKKKLAMIAMALNGKKLIFILFWFFFFVVQHSLWLVGLWLHAIGLIYHSYVHWFHNIMLDWDINHPLLQNFSENYF